MRPDLEARKLAQTLAGRLVIDGIIGPRSQARFRAILDVDLPAERLVAGMIQSHTAATLDFWWGPETDYHADQLWREIQGIEQPTRPDETDDPPPSPRCWKPSDRQMIAAYGRPGSHLETVDLPFAVRLSWDPNTIVTRTSVHPLIAQRFTRALTSIRERFTREERANMGLDLFGGGYNKRTKRGGSTWSAHAFAVAFDWDPDNNRLRWGRDRARFAQPEYRAWWHCWEEQGFIGLGPCFDFDWMHVQANPDSA